MSAVLNTVYNNYLTSYAPKSVTRYDTHKKSELRGVYNSIVQQNKEAPWYLPTTSKDTQRYAIDLKEQARSLHNTIAHLGGLEENGLLNKKSAYTSNNQIATATYIGEQSPDLDVPDLTLEVQSLATSQENMGLFLPNEKIDLPVDTYSFDIAINDMNYEFHFAINEDETNRDLQERLMRLVNNADIGLKASIKESDERTSLVLESVATGSSDIDGHIFTVSDDHTSKRAGAVAYLGLDYVSRQPHNASFLLNGESRSTSSNRFTVGKQFEIELKGISPEDVPVRIGLKADVDSLTENVTHLIQGYNDFIRSVSNYLDSQSKSKALVREMKGIASLYDTSLESTGLNITDDGTMEIDDELLHEAAFQSEDVKETFGYIKDFSSKLLAKSDQVSLDPMNYVNKVVVAYKNPGHNFVSPYAASAYSGMLFNSYC